MAARSTAARSVRQLNLRRMSVWMKSGARGCRTPPVSGQFRGGLSGDEDTHRTGEGLRSQSRTCADELRGPRARVHAGSEGERSRRESRRECGRYCLGALLGITLA